MGTDAETTPVWFINDEVGSTVNHSDAPNIKMISFLYSPSNKVGDLSLVPYTIMWPIQDIKVNEALYKDKL